ncbi:MAG: hypothetical protein ACP5O1_10965 [Phycisphaerae bacterium]
MNAFQKLMRCWTALAPYNAVQAIEIDGIAELAQWRTATDKVVAELTRLKLIPPIRPPANIEYVTDGTSCKDIITRQINTPFTEGGSPIRLCLVQNPRSFHLIVTYDHWIADSWSIREFMRCIYFQACRNSIVTELASGASSDEGTHWLQSCSQCLRQYLRHRRASRLHFSDPLDFTTGLASVALESDLICKVKEAARRKKVSVHDIFVTIIARLLGDLTGEDRYKPRRFGHAARDRVAIGSIVDIRKSLSAARGGNAQNRDAYNKSFGVCLGFTTVVTQAPEKTPVDQLLQTVHQQHLEQKRRSSPTASLAALNLTRFFWNLYKEKRHHAIFFSKNLPLLAGISNVNLTDQWMCQSGEAGMNIRDYFRVSPVGPLLPLVWATTTFNDRLTICLTYRHTAINDQKADALISDFVTMLQSICA